MTRSQKSAVSAIRLGSAKWASGDDIAATPYVAPHRDSGMFPFMLRLV